MRCFSKLCYYIINLHKQIVNKVIFYRTIIYNKIYISSHKMTQGVLKMRQLIVEIGGCAANGEPGNEACADEVEEGESM